MSTTVPGTPAWLRETNDRTALSLLLQHGSLTRNGIGQLSGLSKPTASQIVSRLEAAGLIQVVGEISGGRGPNAVTYGVRSDRVLGVAVDINESVIRSTVVDATGTEHPVVETRLQGDDDRSAVADLRGAIEAASLASATSASTVRLVCVGVQGSVNPRTDELSFIDTLPGWPRTGVRRQLEEFLGRTVHIENDVNLAAIAERSEGAGAGASSFALLWMDDGLGLAVDLDGTVHRGSAGGAGEIGYLPVPRVAAGIDPDAADLQDLIGGPAIVGIARRHGVQGTDAHSIALALTDHPNRSAVFAEMAPRIALGVVPVLAILDPEVVVIGGPIGIAGGDELATLVRSEIERDQPWRPRIRGSAVSGDPVLRGARHTLVHQVRQRLSAELGTLS
ncbi:ROK family transcriptional regulator [soil metagenome]